MKIKRKNSRMKRSILTLRKLLWGLAFFMAMALLILVLEKTNVINFIKPGRPAPQTNQPSGPTPEQRKQEAEATADAKRQMAEGPVTTPKTSVDGKRAVNPVITSASQAELRGFVSGIAEDGGTCTATFTKGTVTFTKTSAGFINVANTNCKLITLSSSDFPSKGNWSITLSYSSSKAIGTSPSTNLEIQ